MYLKCYILQNIKYLNFKMYNNSIKIINKNYFYIKKENIINMMKNVALLIK